MGKAVAVSNWWTNSGEFQASDQTELDPGLPSDDQGCGYCGEDLRPGYWNIEGMDDKVKTTSCEG